MTIRPWALSVRAQGEESIEIDIYDVVGPADGMAMLFGFGSVSAKSVLQTLRANPGVKDIVVRINSVGGDVYDGMAIYSMLKDSIANVRVYVDGLCASIASVIAMAGDVICMSEGAWMMVHRPYADMLTGCGADDLRKTAETLDKFADTIADVYAARTGRSKEDCLGDMVAETWMTAEEALEFGYATEIAPAKSNDAADSAVVASLTKQHSRLPAAALMAMARAYGTPMKIKAEEDKKPVAEEDKKTLAEEDKAEDEDLKKARKRANDAEDRARAAEEKLAEYEKKMAEEDETDEDKAKAEFPKKEKKDPEEEDSTAGPDEEARAMAMLCATVVKLTGAKDLFEAEAKFVAMFDRAAKVPDLEQGKHVARVEKMIAKGLLTPARKAWALAAKPSQLDAYLEATGGEPIVPIGGAHVADPAAAEGTAESITAESKLIAKGLGLTEAQAAEAAKLAKARNYESQIPGVR